MAESRPETGSLLTPSSGISGDASSARASMLPPQPMKPVGCQYCAGAGMFRTATYSESSR